MSTNIICFYGELRKIAVYFGLKKVSYLELGLFSDKSYNMCL